jgi:hypothetical protein
LWMMPLVLVTAASASLVTCQAGAASIPVLDPFSVSGAVGDYTLDCTGGTPVSPPPLVDFSAFMNLPVLHTGGWILTNGVSDFAGSNPGGGNLVQFLSVPFNPPGSGHVHWEIENIFVNPTFLPPGAPFEEVVSISGQIAPVISDQVQVVGVNAPEPSTLLPVGILLIGIEWLRRRKRWRYKKDATR